MRTSLQLLLSSLWLVFTTTAFAAVNVSGFSPGYGAPGDIIYIYGSGFYPGSVIVKFNGTRDYTAQATSADGTIIQAAVPTGSTTGPISVQVGSSSASSLTNFVVIGPGPYIEKFTPIAGAGGSTMVEITGKRFYYPNPATQVTFDGKVVPAGSWRIVSDTLIEATPPASAATGPIKVTTPLGSFTTSSNFFITPSFTAFTPTSGRAGTNVIVTGQNFLGAISVEFNGLATTDLTVLSNKALRVAVPVGAARGIVRVNTPAGSAESTTLFTLPPTVFGFTPTFGPENASIVITGANFNVGTPSVSFNGLPAATPTGISFGELTAKVPVGATSGPLTVTTSDGSHKSIALFYLPPVITGISPNRGGAGTTVLITGQNLTNASAVKFDGIPAVSFTVSNNTAIYAIAPVEVHSGKITVLNPGGTAISPANFYVAPAITLFIPTHGLPGTNVAIYGKNFLDATAVEFNGVPASFNVASNEFLSAVVPVGAQTGPITIKAPGGTNSSTTPFVLDYASDVGLSGGDTPDPVWFGSNLVYSLTVTNGGPHEAPHTRIVAQLPTNSVIRYVYSSRAGTIWTTNNNVLTADIGTLNKLQWVNLEIGVTPAVIGTAGFVATVSSDYNDPFLSNNTVTLDTMVRPLPLLDIRLVSTNRVRVGWPEMLSNFVLQYRPDLLPTSHWSNSTTSAVIVEGQRTVTERTTNGVRFYRLQGNP